MSIVYTRLVALRKPVAVCRVGGCNIFEASLNAADRRTRTRYSKARFDRSSALNAFRQQLSRVTSVLVRRRRRKRLDGVNNEPLACEGRALVKLTPLCYLFA